MAPPGVHKVDLFLWELSRDKSSFTMFAFRAAERDYICKVWSYQWLISYSCGTGRVVVKENEVYGVGVDINHLCSPLPSHVDYVKDGLKHMRIKFYIEGSEPGMKGTVHTESKEVCVPWLS